MVPQMEGSWIGVVRGSLEISGCKQRVSGSGWVWSEWIRKWVGVFTVDQEEGGCGHKNSVNWWVWLCCLRTRVGMVRVDQKEGRWVGVVKGSLEIGGCRQSLKKQVGVVRVAQEEGGCGQRVSVNRWVWPWCLRRG